MLAISFAFFAALEWKLSKHNNSGGHAFWWIFTALLLWNLAANLIPWWPSPNRLVMLLMGWVPSLH